MFGQFDANAQQEIFRIKRNLLQMRKVLAPERDVLNVLMRRDTPIFSDETVRYFQDIYDHLLRVLDSIDTYRDLLSSALDSYLSVQSNRMNKVMKTLTASSIILMSVTLIASIYGMNFVSYAGAEMALWVSVRAGVDGRRSWPGWARSSGRSTGSIATRPRGPEAASSSSSSSSGSACTATG